MSAAEHSEYVLRCGRGNNSGHKIAGAAETPDPLHNDSDHERPHYAP